MSIDTIKAISLEDGFDIINKGNSYFPAVSVSAPGAGNYIIGTANSRIAHGLSYTPTVLGFVQVSNKSYQIPFTIYFGSAATASHKVFEIFVDETYIYLNSQVLAYGIADSIAANTYQAQFYILRDRAKRQA